MPSSRSLRAPTASQGGTSAIAKSPRSSPVWLRVLNEAHAVEDFRYALDIIQHHLTPSPDRPGEWILTSGGTVIRVRADQVEALRATVTKELKTYMAQLVKAMVRVWETYDSIQRGNSTFQARNAGRKLRWPRRTRVTQSGITSKNSLIQRARHHRLHPLVDRATKYVAAFRWIMHPERRG